MKIVVLSQRSPMEIGGVERMVRELSIRLGKMHEVHVVCLGRYAAEDLYRGVKIHTLKGHLGSAFPPFGYMDKVLGLRPDWIYAHNFSSFVPFAAARIKRVNPLVKLLLHPHYHPVEALGLKSFVRLSYDSTLGKMNFDSADGIVANSKSELKAIRNRFMPSSPIYVLYNGIDIGRLQYAKAQQLQGPRIPILFVGRLVSYKNPLRTVSLMRSLPAEYHLYIIGAGPLERKLRKLIEVEHLVNRVTMVGVVSDNELASWYKAVCCLVHLSRSESFGMTCIEALAAGTPCVVNDDGFGLSETMRMFPRSIFASNVEKESDYQLSNLIQRVASLKPVREDLTMFSWDTLASRLISILEDPVSAFYSSEANNRC